MVHYYVLKMVANDTLVVKSLSCAQNHSLEIIRRRRYLKRVFSRATLNFFSFLPLRKLTQRPIEHLVQVIALAGL
jgi:hypothetical protein